MDLPNEDIERGKALLSDVAKLADEATAHIASFTRRVSGGELPTAKGVSFLETKNHTLLSYLTSLAHLMYCKVSGQSLQDSPDVWRLIETRTILEKMRPIDQKLRYQVDKLIKSESGVADNDPLRLKPNPGGLVSKLDEDNSDEEEGEEKTKVYKPPKMAAVHYDGDDTMVERRDKQAEKHHRRLMSSSVLRELRAEMSDRPEEITEGRDLHRHKADTRAKEQREYEESYFMRHQPTKAEKHASRKMATMGGLSSLASFGDIFNDGKGSSGGPGAKRGQKRNQTGKGKKSTKKKRFH